VGCHFQYTEELQTLLHGMFSLRFRKAVAADKAQSVYQKSSKRIAAALRAEKPSGKDTRKDLLADLIQLYRDRPEFTETYLRRLAVTNFGAGHETMCSALTSIMTMIGSHSGTAQQIRDEISSTVAAPQIISHDDALRLRYTQACIKEAQRLHPVIGMSLPRRAPVEGLSLHGYRIPPGTTVGCNPVSLHRNPEVFGPDADVYLPERWLGDDVEAVRAMERYNLAWGGGARTCPGRHLAEMMLYKIVPALIREFNVDVVAMPREKDVKYYFMAMLTGVKARFVPMGGEKGASVALEPAGARTMSGV
jgi:cytochrome P450